MSRHVELPRDGWAELADRGELSTRTRRSVERRMVDLYELQDRLQAKDGPPEIRDFRADELEKVYALQNATIVALVVDWSYGDLPEADNVEDLPADVYDALSRAVLEPLDGPEFEPTKDRDPGNPTGSSGGSGNASKAALPAARRRKNS